MTRYPLELCLDAKCSVLDAISELRRVEELNYRLDLRIIKDTERGSIEITTGGFASSKAATEKKFYCDKPKLILATECHYSANDGPKHFVVFLFDNWQAGVRSTEYNGC